jgi:hypothetical protein
MVGVRVEHNGGMAQGFSSEGDTPTPGLVAAWLALDTLRAELVPRWAADWLVDGYDGESLVDLAGLSGRDSREVRDLLPAALADAGMAPLSSRQTALKVAYDHIATMHLSGRVRWTWVVSQVVEVVAGNEYAVEVFEQPLGALWGIHDELGEPWSRTDDELAGIVRTACVEQVQQ